MMAQLSNTALRAIEAYGGAQKWLGVQGIEAVVSAHGLAFTLKRRKAFQHATITLNAERPYARLLPIGKRTDVAGVLDGQDVALEDVNGVVIAKRKDARSYFPAGRRFRRWDDLDMSYFACYAFWNYFTLPLLLMNPKIQWSEPENGRLLALFPPEIPTHSATQEFIFHTQTGLLVQHNYTVEVFGNWANAANVVVAHQEFDGIPVAAVRKVTPMIPTNHKPLGFPILIAIEVHDFKLR